jgi:hypothetical protein
MNFISALLATASIAALPIGSESKWRVLSFDGTGLNEVASSEEGVEIAVSNSASALLFVFPKSREIGEFAVAGAIEGTQKQIAGANWENAPDDALLRVGVIETGDRKLNPLERIAALRWVKELESMLDGGSEGIGKTHCFHLLPEEEWIGESREKPSISLFHETVVATPSDTGAFAWTNKFVEPVKARGFWVIADGDNMQSQFTTTIKEL